MHWFILLFIYYLSQVGCMRVSTLNFVRDPSEDSIKAVASVRELPSQLHKCSAAFLNPRWLITTARCVFMANTSKLFVHALSQHLTDHSELGKIFKIKTIVVHPNYERTPHQNDLGLIEIFESANNAKFLSLPLNLPTSKLPGYIYKWEFSQNQADFFLHPKNASTVTRAMCSLILRKYIDCNYICARSSNNIFMGSMDQGTPFTVHHNQNLYIIGMFNREGLPTGMTFEIFMFLMPYISWINFYIKGEKDFPTTPHPTHTTPTSTYKSTPMYTSSTKSSTSTPTPKSSPNTYATLTPYENSFSTLYPISTLNSSVFTIPESSYSAATHTQMAKDTFPTTSLDYTSTVTETPITDNWQITTQNENLGTDSTNPLLPAYDDQSGVGLSIDEWTEAVDNSEVEDDEQTDIIPEIWSFTARGTYSTLKKKLGVMNATTPIPA